jgi:hypothetical protein
VIREAIHEDVAAATESDGPKAPPAAGEPERG